MNRILFCGLALGICSQLSGPVQIFRRRSPLSMIFLIRLGGGSGVVPV